MGQNRKSATAPARLVVGISGASGVVYGARLLELLQPLAIETHVHLLSDHVQAALSAGWSLAEMHEQVIDDRWIAAKPSWSEHRDVPISFAFVWRRNE